MSCEEPQQRAHPICHGGDYPAGGGSRAPPRKKLAGWVGNPVDDPAGGQRAARDGPGDRTVGESGIAPGPALIVRCRRGALRVETSDGDSHPLGPGAMEGEPPNIGALDLGGVLWTVVDYEGNLAMSPNMTRVLQVGGQAVESRQCLLIAVAAAALSQGRAGYAPPDRERACGGRPEVLRPR